MRSSSVFLGLAALLVIPSTTLGQSPIVSSTTTYEYMNDDTQDDVTSIEVDATTTTSSTSDEGQSNTTSASMTESSMETETPAPAAEEMTVTPSTIMPSVVDLSPSPAPTVMTSPHMESTGDTPAPSVEATQTSIPEEEGDSDDTDDAEGLKCILGWRVTWTLIMAAALGVERLGGWRLPSVF